MPENALSTAIRKIDALEKKVRNLETIQNGHTLGDVLARALMFPELRGLWGFGSVNESGNIIDLSGQGRILTNNNAAPRGVLSTGVPYAALNGSTQYLSRADEAGLDITGAMTVLCWTKFDALGADVACMSKYLDTGNQRSWFLGKSSTDALFMAVYADGATITNIANAGVVTSTSSWIMLAGRFTPSTELAVFYNSTKGALTTGVPASIYSGSGPFHVGARSSAGSPLFLDGNIALCVLCAAALSDALINRWFNMTRPYFGV